MSYIYVKNCVLLSIKFIEIEKNDHKIFFISLLSTVVLYDIYILYVKLKEL